jgi:hypothetical protein
MDDQIRGLDPQGPPSCSMVNLLLPLQVADGGKPTPMFALAHWLLPRVPMVGEEIEVIGYRMTIERVSWDIEGRALVRLHEGHLESSALEALENEGWSPLENEPPSDLLAG